MAKDGKFGTFGGVFTPSILTILGVIMYLRLPWVVGSGGLTTALIIIVVAHVVSVTTGLSISSIATDKKVGAGGPYYIISRSFGLPIGGAIGVALFLGLSLSISLYLVGFSESFLPAIGYDVSKSAIRVCGSATIAVLAAITLISTSLAIKTQYLVLGIIALSLVSITFGVPGTGETAAVATEAAAESPSFAVLFGIFFPAVTGFTAGVNMSGDLRDPKGSIPNGTMLAIGVGLVVYVGLAFFLARRVDPEALRENPRILQEIAVYGPVVVAGIWSATLSSALGSLLGAPRILQAMSADRITPRVFARGYGPTSEPRNALVLALAIGEGGILIAELDVIARVVSMVFLAMYGSVNITCAIESWASPDFRPRFRIPKTVSIIGAVACVLLMIQLDIIAMLAASAFMLLVFGYLQRRQLTLESGDTWEGIWSSLVRIGLKRLEQSKTQRRSWRPNVLLFDEADNPNHASIRSFASTLTSGNGMVTDFALVQGEGSDADATRAAQRGAEDGAADVAAGMFDRRLTTDRPLQTAGQLCVHHGFSGLEPNTVLLPWRSRNPSASEFLSCIQTAADAGLNILIFEEPGDSESKKNSRIDVWWSRDGGNLALSVALLRFITRAEGWDRASVTVYLIAEDLEEDEILRGQAERYLADTRLDATVRLIAHPGARGSHHELVLRESQDADLIVLGLPHELSKMTESELADLESVSGMPGGVVFQHAGGPFVDVLDRRSVEKLDTPTQSASSIEELEQAAALTPPEHPLVAEAAWQVHEHVRSAVLRNNQRLIKRAYGLHASLCQRASELVDARSVALREALAESDPSKRRMRAHAAAQEFADSASRLLAEFEETTVVSTTEIMREEIAAIDGARDELLADVPAILKITRKRADYRSQPGDGTALRAWKSRQRWRFFYRRNLPQSIAMGKMARATFDKVVADALVAAVARLRTDCHEILLEVGRILTRSEWQAVVELSGTIGGEADDLGERIDQSQASSLERLGELRGHLDGRVQQFGSEATSSALSALRQLFTVLQRVDAPVLTRSADRRDKKRAQRLETMASALQPWNERQLALCTRLRLAAQVASARTRLTVVTARHCEDLVVAVRESGKRSLDELGAQLRTQRERGALEELPEPREDLQFDATGVVARFARAAAAAVQDLAATETILTDASAAEVMRGADLEQVALPVRSAVQALVELELIARWQTEVARLVDADMRAWAVVRDTIRHVAAGPSSDDEDEEASVDDLLSDAAERVEGQIARTLEAERALVEGMLEGLEAVGAATAVDRLASSLEIARRGRERARSSKLRQLVERNVDRVRQLAARAVYRRSAGVVFARRQRGEGAHGAALTVRELARQSSTSPEVLTNLPLSYRHLFGQNNINESFFLCRHSLVEEGVRGLAREQQSPRTVLVTGDRGSGKTTLCQQIATRAGRCIWLSPPAGGASNATQLRASLKTAISASPLRDLGLRSATQSMQILDRLPADTVIVIDDIDLWWERREGGLDAIEEIMRWMTARGDEIGFLVAGSSHTVRVLNQLRYISRAAHNHLVCQPLAARDLQEIIMSRHNSTGMRLRVGRRGETTFGVLSRARLFDSHFDYSRGNVGYSLRAWLAHIENFSDDELSVRRPRPLDWDAFDDLSPDLIATLVELLLHKQLSARRLERISGRTAADAHHILSEICALGLGMQNRRRVVHLSPFVQVPVMDWLERRDLV